MFLAKGTTTMIGRLGSSCFTSSGHTSLANSVLDTRWFPAPSFSGQKAGRWVPALIWANVWYQTGEGGRLKRPKWNRNSTLAFLGFGSHIFSFPKKNKKKTCQTSKANKLSSISTQPKFSAGSFATTNLLVPSSRLGSWHKLGSEACGHRTLLTAPDIFTSSMCLKGSLEPAGPFSRCHAFILWVGKCAGKKAGEHKK